MTTTDTLVDLTTVEAIDDTWRDTIANHAADMWDVDADTGHVDWEDWADRFERMHNVDLGSDMLAPSFRKVQRIARTAIREARA